MFGVLKSCHRLFLTLTFLVFSMGAGSAANNLPEEALQSNIHKSPSVQKVCNHLQNISAVSKYELTQDITALAPGGLRANPLDIAKFIDDLVQVLWGKTLSPEQAEWLAGDLDEALNPGNSSVKQAHIAVHDFAHALHVMGLTQAEADLVEVSLKRLAPLSGVPDKPDVPAHKFRYALAEAPMYDKHVLVEDFESGADIFKTWYQPDWSTGIVPEYDSLAKSTGKYDLTISNTGPITKASGMAKPGSPPQNFEGCNALRMWIKPYGMDSSQGTVTIGFMDGSGEVWQLDIPDMLAGTEPYILQVRLVDFERVVRRNNGRIDPENRDFCIWMMGTYKFTVDDIMFVHDPALPDFSGTQMPAEQPKETSTLKTPAARPDTIRTIRFCMTDLLHDHAWWFADQMLATPGIELVGVASERDDLLDRMRKKLPASAEFFHEVRPMLDRLKPDALVVLAPNNRHRKIVEEAARRRIHCITDNPISASYQDAVAMKKTAERAGTKLMVNCYSLWDPGTAELFRLVKDGQIGEIYEVTTTMGMKGPKMGLGVLTPQYVEWLYDPVQNGGGVLNTNAVHCILYSILLLGRPQTVYARLVPVVKHPEGWIDDSCYLILGYPKATAVISGSWAWPYPRGEISAFGSKGSLAIRFGEPPAWESHLKWRNAPESIKPGLSWQNDTILRTIPLPEIPLERKNGIAYFAHCIRNNLEIEYSQSAAVHVIVMEVIEAAKQSATKGKMVTLPDIIR